MQVSLARSEVGIAYAVTGGGPRTLLAIPGWVSHLSEDWATPELRRYYERLGHGRRLIRYDKRGTGMSDRPEGPGTYGPAAQMADVAAVLNAAGVERAALLGWSEGGAIAISFAAAHPERVSHLILYGAFARLTAAPDYPVGNDGTRIAALTDLVRTGWGLGSRVLADLFVPEADRERLEWFTRYQRLTT